MLSEFGKRVERPEDMPGEDHYAILLHASVSVHVPGDETQHAYTLSGWEYWAISNGKIKDAVLFLENPEEQSKILHRYKVVYSNPVTVNLRTVVDLSPFFG